jgi:hypothetical protein
VVGFELVPPHRIIERMFAHGVAVLCRQ